jgi:hypothetical protein
VTDKEYQRQVRRIERTLEKWLKRLCINNGVGGWSIGLDVQREPFEDCNVIARVFPSWKYLYADVVFSAPRVATLTDQKLDWATVHELVHLFVQEMNEEEDKINHEERTVSTITRALFNVMESK